MRAQDLIRTKKNPVKTYLVKVKIRQPGYVNVIDTTVQAINPEMARRLVRVQYNSRDVIVGQPRELRARTPA
jgi:hypothetical protein